MKHDQTKKPDLRDLTLAQVKELVAGLGEKPFRVGQIMGWLYKKAAPDIEAMTDLSRGLRQELAKLAGLSRLHPSQVQQSADGTRKLLYVLEDGARMESVLIPEDDHHTLCVSTQVGCRQGCKFCRTATLGFVRNLRPSEITGQVLAAQQMTDPLRPLTNLVFMGMGEPLDNLDSLLTSLSHILGAHGLQMSQRKVTVSTVGLVDRLEEFSQATPAALAVSLGAADDQLRSRLMPVNRRWPLDELKKALLAYPLKPTRRITFEYVLLKGVNDRPGQAQELADWLKGLKCKVNLIPFNPFPGAKFEAPAEKDVERFQEVLIQKHVTALLRRSRGADICAACGMLAAQPA